MALVSVAVDADELHPPFRPVRVLVVEISRPLPDLTGGRTRDGLSYGIVRTLVTVHDEPVGLLDHDVSAGTVPAEALAHAVYAELGAAIDRHLREDGLEVAWSLGAEGLALDDSGSRPGVEVCPGTGTDGDSSVSVVLSTTGRRAALERSLDSLLGSDHHSFEVMVVDRGAPTAGVRAVVDRRRELDGRVRYLAAHGETRSTARNRAFGLSRGQVVAFTDEGCAVTPGWMSSLAATFDRHPDAAAVVGPVLTFELETPPQLALEAATAVTGGWSRRVMGRSGPVDGPTEPPFLSGLYGSGDNLAVHKHLLDDLWGFDPHLGPGSPAGAADDLDVLVGVLADGKQVAFEPRALVWRRHPDDVATARAVLRDREVGLGAMLTKQMLIGRLPRREVLKHVVPTPGSPDPTSAASPGAHLVSGVWAYVRSRIKSGWVTA